MTVRKRFPSGVLSSGLCVWCVVLAGSTSVAAPPSITSIAPRGFLPGSSTEISIGGQNLESTTELWTSWGMKYAPAHAEGGAAKFSLEIPAETPLGLHAIRVLTPGGVSDLHLVVVDDLPSIAKGGGNQSAQTAQELPVPCAVDGYVDNLTRDFYQFNAKAGERLSFEVLSRRLGSPLDPALILYQADGKELAYSDDAEGLSGDAQLEYQFETDGTFLLEIRDIAYSGSAQHVYRLRIGDFPCINVPVPMGVQRGQRARVDFAGVSTTDANPAWATVPADWPHSWFPVSTRRPDGQSSGFSQVTVGDAPEYLEFEPNNTLPQANSISLGTQINGRFETPGDIDRFRFTARKGERFVFRGVTRERAAPTDLILELQDSSGKQVARVDDAKTAEGTLDQTFPADGEYVLAVSDLHHRGGPQYAYRVEVTNFQPGFDLAVGADSLNVPAGGVGSVTVNVNRRGYDGPIAVSLVGLPEGWTVLPTTIGAGMSVGELTVHAVEGASTASVLDGARVIGTASIGGTEVRETATIADTLRGRWNQVAVIPNSVEQSFAAAAAAPLPFGLSAEPAEVVLGKHLKTTVKVVAQRGEAIDEAIELAAVLDKAAFPQDVTLNLQPIAKGSNEIALELAAGPKAPSGAFTIVLHGTHKKDKATETAIATPINFRLEAPLALSAEIAGPVLKREGQLEVKVSVQRNPALGGDIKLTLSKAPTGISAAEVIVPDGESSAMVTLAASGDAVAGEHTDMTIEAVAVANDKVTASTGLGKIMVE